MPTDGLGADDPVADQLRRMSASVRELSARIARLATSLGVNLENESELEQVLHIDAVRLHLARLGVTSWSDEMKVLAQRWALNRASRSGRVAYQFARDYAGRS